ncbi:MAG: hypothetical protein WD530_07190 [Vicingaceae bacterium]
MDIIESIIQYFEKDKNKPAQQTESKAPQGLCPVCWGYQEYDGKIRKLFKDKQVDINNHRDSYLIIQEFVKKNVDSMKLKEGEIKSCPTCGETEEKHNK